MKVMRKVETKESYPGMEAESDVKVVKRHPKLNLLSNDEMASRRLTVSCPGDAHPIGGKIISKRSSMHVADNTNEKSSDSPEVVGSEFTQIFSKFQRRSSHKANEQGESKGGSDDKETEKSVVQMEKSVSTSKANVIELPKPVEAHIVPALKTFGIGTQKPAAGTHTDVKLDSGTVIADSNLKSDAKIDRGVTNVLSKSSTENESSGIISAQSATSISVETRKNMDVGHAVTHADKPVSTMTRTPSRVYGAKFIPSTTAAVASSPPFLPAVKLPSAHSTHTPSNANSSVSPTQNSEVETSELPAMPQKGRATVSSSTSAAGKNILFTSADEKVTAKTPEKLAMIPGKSTVFSGPSLSFNSSKVTTSSEKKVTENEVAQHNPIDSKPKLEISSNVATTILKEVSPGITSATRVQKSNSISYNASVGNQSKYRSNSQSDSSAAQSSDDVGKTHTTVSLVSPLVDPKQKPAAMSSEKKHERTHKDSAGDVATTANKSSSYIPGTVVYSSAKSVDNSYKGSIISQSPHISKNLPILMSPGTSASRDNKMSKSLDSAEIRKATGVTPAVSNVNIGHGGNVSGGNVVKPTVRSGSEGTDTPLIIASSGVKSSAIVSSSTAVDKGKPAQSFSGNAVEAEPAWFAMARRKTKDWNDGRL